MDRTMSGKPFLKWVGGKTQILEKVFEQFPTTLQNYHEPFAGGGSVFLHLLQEIDDGKRTLNGSMYISDSNPHLIQLYKHIQTDCYGFLREALKIADPFYKIQERNGMRKPATYQEALQSQESYYYWMRQCYNQIKQTPCLTTSALFLFLNKTCYRGLYRENRAGEMNAPFGNYNSPLIYDALQIIETSMLIKDVIFTCQEFEESLQRCVAGDFVYLDPPYVPETETSFVKYTADGFTLDHHKKLFQMCKQLKENHIQFVLSNADITLVRQTFPSPAFTTLVFPARRAIHNKDPSTTTREVLIY